MQIMKRSSVAKIAKYIALILISIIVLFPIYAMVATSLKTRVDAFSMPPKWIFKPTLDNYRDILTEEKFPRYLMNSIIIALSTAFLTMFIGALAAYAMVRFKFLGKRVMSTGTLLLRMIPSAVLIIPIFILWTRFGLINRRVGLIFIYIAINLSFTIWVLSSFMMDIPVEIEESAVIDGCSELGIFFRMILPLIKPGLAVASIFVFRIAWNEFIMALILTNRYTRTLPVAIAGHMTLVGVQWGRITAMATIVALPAFVFTFFSAKSIIRGITAGAVKG